MNEPISQQNQDLILKLDQARGIEVAAIRKDMETFLRGQLEIEHKIEIVATNQNGMKERMEQGISKTLFNLDKKVDQLLMEAGTKKAEDSARDKEIIAAKESALKAHDRSDFLVKGFAIAIFGGIGMVALIWAIKTLIH